MGRIRDCASDPTCSACRTAGDLHDHDSCTGCIGCGCALSARFARWANGPTCPLITED